MDEKKEEVKVEDNKGKGKEKKPKKEKKILPDFDKIDVTVATEDEIIRSGIKKVTKTDIICYFVIAITIILMILPFGLRILIPKPITEIEMDIAYVELKCYRTIIKEGNELSSSIIINYRDGSNEKATINFTYKRSNDDYTFDDIEELDTINHKGLTKEENENKVTYTLDFENNMDLKNIDELRKYSGNLGVEEQTLRGINYSCISDSETKKELVYVDTRKKVE
ncbi:MAG: hypothetical protein IJ568_00345 [Bacilli bacterium]|nr:hypothetical protein [Bacilli bacterium]